jgi:glucosamine--fructose-6-phosphate aminotransferase (isomerizing)
MCGIFGVVTVGHRDKAEELLGSLFRLSESRGKEASGLAGIAGDTIRVLKSPVSSKQLMKTREYASYVKDVVRTRERVATIGHSRLVTNGSQVEHANNQPVAVDGVVGVHNGIIVNEAALARANPDLRRSGEVDTEVLFGLIRKRATDGVANGLRRAFADVEGVANVAMFAAELDHLALATNNGSLYYARVGDLFAFASEQYILDSALADCDLSGTATHLAAGHGLLVDLSTISLQRFSLADEPVNEAVIEHNGVHRTIHIDEPAQRATTSSHAGTRDTREPSWFTEVNDRHREAIGKLRRCVRCVQPETVPFVDLDDSGVCVDCRNYQPIVTKGRAALEAILESRRSRSDRADVLVPLSGGRDSCYALHYIKTELGLNPIAYTYDWGMVTDLARRNCSRLCSKLGIEHIIVSADIPKKRTYIRKNVEAWLTKPDLGVIPLFMAGDKQYFYYAEQVQKRTGLSFQIWGNNRLERSDFKTGFCGFDRGGYKDNSLIRMGARHNAQILAYYAKQYLTNRGYLNSSIPDTLFSYFIYYLKKLDYLDFYDYIPWDETTVVETIISRYDWETAPDTKSTWRIGDGTAAFYNFIYWTAAGFTESDTFRAGQVRNGTLTRDQALRIVEEENRPRWASLDWYCRTIGIDLERALRTIQAMPKLYAL